MDLAIARGLAAQSADHDRLWACLERSGTLRLRAQLNLVGLLRPAEPAGSVVVERSPPERLSVVFRARTIPRVESPSRSRKSTTTAQGLEQVTLSFPEPTSNWATIEISVQPGLGS